MSYVSGGGAMGASASGSLAVEKEHSEASKKLDALASGSVQVAYKVSIIAHLPGYLMAS